MSSEALLAEYDRVLPTLQARSEARARELRALLATVPALKVHSVTARLKDRASLARKLARPDRNYTELWMVTDLIGVRVLTYFADEIDRVAELVEAHLPVEFDHSIDKRRRESVDFGYRSLHYVCRMGDPLPERACFEIQLQTVLEHSWAEIEHDLGYKVTAAIPLVARRRLNRLAGLLELADQEFVAIRDDLESYARALPTRIAAERASVPLDRLSLVALLGHGEVQALDGAISSALHKELGEELFYPDYLLQMLVACGVQTTEDALRGIREQAPAITAMVVPYFTLAEQLWQLSPARMPHLLRGYSLFFLTHVELLRSSSLRLEQIERLARLYRQLDYPDDAKQAHHVASLLVAALGHS
jgi:ppGpp synthetase/RelA/SpoT-type nucleotidyltranferase